VWSLLMGQERLQMVWTDPPYGVAIVGGNHSLSPEERAAKGGKSIQNDALKPAELEQFLRDALGIAAAHCKPGASWYVAAPQMVEMFSVFIGVLKELEIAKHILQWVKNSLVMGRSDYHYRHEPIFYGWTPGAAHYFVDERTHDSVLEFNRPTKSTDHPTMKPVELVAYCINNSSKPGWLVGEPFGGSGTTLIAAAQTGRIARVIELDPRYCDVIRRRWTRWAKEHGKTVGRGALE
jgi:site-specific DNA-methyltransferase (adenine-specific)